MDHSVIKCNFWLDERVVAHSLTLLSITGIWYVKYVGYTECVGYVESVEFWLPALSCVVV